MIKHLVWYCLITTPYLTLASSPILARLLQHASHQPLITLSLSLVSSMFPVCPLNHCFSPSGNSPCSPGSPVLPTSLHRHQEKSPPCLPAPTASPSPTEPGPCPDPSQLTLSLSCSFINLFYSPPAPVCLWVQLRDLTNNRK